MGRISRFSALLGGAVAGMWPAAALAQDSGGSAGGAAGGIIGLCCSGLMFIVLIALLVLWVWMLIDCIKRPDEQFAAGMSKVVWIVLLILFSYIAAAIYYFVVYRKLGKA